MTDKIITKYGKRFFLDSINDYKGFKRRLSLLKKVHPKLKYIFVIKGRGKNTQFCLYVRKWGN